ncbi:MAG: hypothetical protein KDC98_14775 [Planctomycetes bacterium]|nr:hypothetical protein [Planctomycetota bacterium]
MADDDKKAEAAKKAEAKPAELAAEVQKRAQSLCASMNKAFDAERKKTVDAAVAALKKALEDKAKKSDKGGKLDEKDFAEKAAAMKANIPTFKMALSAMRVSADQRSGEDQAWYAIKKWSKTCISAHLHHAAIHVEVQVTRGSKNATIGLKDYLTYFPATFKPTDHLHGVSWGVMSFATFKANWISGLKSAVLADASGTKQGFQSFDPWHVELPSEKMKGIPAGKETGPARPGYSDKEVLACIDHYAEYAAHVDAIEDDKERKNHKKNSSIEKNYKKTFKNKYKAHKQKLDAAKKKVEKDDKKKKEVEADIVKKVKSMKGRMDKTYDEIVELKESGETAVP